MKAISLTFWLFFKAHLRREQYFYFWSKCASPAVFYRPELQLAMHMAEILLMI